MSWERILLDFGPSPTSLHQRIDMLFENQRSAWQTFREGEASLASMRTKHLSGGDARLIVQVNPGRRTSIHARVDPVSASGRPCFLCAENMPLQERGIGCGDLVILPNPHPILPLHLTIPTREHSPQKLEGRIGSLLALARALGPRMLVLYNGARCGASVPDHFHFQACGTAGVPLLEEVSEIRLQGGITVVRSFGRKMLVCQSDHDGRVEAFIRRTLDALSELGTTGDEPLINIIAVHREGRHRVLLFPRAKHRPQCYFADADSRISVSPAALEMAGVLVVADADHFERIDEATALAIYQEVSLEEETFTRIAERLK